jgi:TRAP-type C4-dicarboxylate transport system permease small subunit
MIWTAMLAAALLVQEDGHLQISLLTGRFGPRGRAILYFCAQFVVLAFLAMLVLSSALRLPSIVKQNTVTLGISMVWFYAALPVSGALMFIFAMGNIIARLRAPKTPRNSSAPAQPDSPI